MHAPEDHNTGEIRASAEDLYYGPEPSLGSRLLFGWLLVWATIITVLISIVQVITHQLHPTATNFKRVAGIWGRWILAGAGIRTHVRVQYPLNPVAPYIFVSNHQNSLDILALIGALPYPFGFVAKEELRRIPFLGLAIRSSPSVYIDRSNPRRAIESLREAGEKIRSGNSVLVFAEGSRSFSPVLQPFKAGAFQIAQAAGVPIVPVTIVDAYRLLNEPRRAARPGSIYIVIGAPIPTAGLGRKDIPALMEAVRVQIGATLEGSTEAHLREPRSPGSRHASHGTVPPGLR